MENVTASSDLVLNATLVNLSMSSSGGQLETFHLAVATCCLVLSVLGLLGNALALLVWGDTRMQRSSPSLSVLLMGLAAFDLLFLVCLSLSTHLYTALYYSQHSTSLLGESTLWVVQALTYPPMHVFRLASVYVTVAVTLERALAVTQPLKAVSFATKTSSRLCLLGVGIASVVFNLPRFWERQLVAKLEPVTNQTYLYLDGTTFTKTTFFRVYNLYFQFVAYFVIPFIVIVVCNSAILWTLHREAGNVKSSDGVIPLRSFRGQQSSRPEEPEAKLLVCADGIKVKEKKKKKQGKNSGKTAGRNDGSGHLTATVMALTICFFVTHLLPAVSLVLKYMEINGLSKLDEGSAEIQYLQGIGYILVTFNSSSNFLFFSLLGRKFRTVLMSRSCCYRPGRREEVSKATSRRSESSITSVPMDRQSRRPPSDVNSTVVTHADSLSSSSSSVKGSQLLVAL